MAVCIETGQFSRSSPNDTAGQQTRIDIGLVNNMPDAALSATERQFVSLLEAASHDLDVRLHLLRIPDIPRSAAAAACIVDHAPVCDLPRHCLDGLIVTGTEPRTRRLQDEVYWRSFTGLVDWAAGNTVSTLFSCLAAHAAVLHLDGIERHPLAGKLSGVFECGPAGDHRLHAGLPRAWRVPHSRCNEIRAEDLTARGYRLLSVSAEAGVDMFTRGAGSEFVFCQGHPEYDAHSLLKEYGRDIGRFLRGERATFPEMPRGYLAAGAEAAFTHVRDTALAGGITRAGELAARAADEAAPAITAAWRAPAEQLYGNWLTSIVAKKASTGQPAFAIAS